MKRKKIAGPKRGFRAFQWISALGLGIVLLGLGALGWLLGRYGFEGHDGWGDAALNTQYWSLKVHGAGVMVFLFGLGTHGDVLWPDWKQLRTAERSRWIAILGFLGLLIFSGWLLYYGPTSDIQDLIIKAHWILGLVAMGGLGYWLGMGKSKKRR
jgi:peptidoglycan/LPS O-acetylase OafA/YrhL